MRVLVLGAGMLAHYLRPYHLNFASKSGKDWENFHLLDIRNIEALRNVVENEEPDVVINTAALGNIRWCEEHPELAEEHNHLAHRNVVSVCNERGIRLVYISTSSVFSGKMGNYREEDVPHPTTVYGQTKLRGEEATKDEAENWGIFRVTSLFGDYPGKRDFVWQIIHDLGQGKTFTCWDQLISPSYGPFVAKAIMRLVERRARGIWHVAGKEQLSRYDIGTIIRRHVGKGEIRRVNTPEALPGNRSLCVEKLRRELPDLEFPGFESCVRKMIEGE